MAKVELTIPTRAPVMVLPNTLLFPHALMPLFIFEPRYRAMLAWALEHDRVFCVALRKPEANETRTADDFLHTAGIGMIRACVGHDDGTSHLMLQGLARVRFASFAQTEPFFIANLEVLPSEAVDGPAMAALGDEVRTLCRQFTEHGIAVPAGVDEFLSKMESPEQLADSVAYSFLRDPLRRQELLEELDVKRRLQGLIRHLRQELSLLP